MVTFRNQDPDLCRSSSPAMLRIDDYQQILQ
jgi:hypothetical protein